MRRGFQCSSGVWRQVWAIGLPGMMLALFTSGAAVAEPRSVGPGKINAPQTVRIGLLRYSPPSHVSIHSVSPFRFEPGGASVVEGPVEALAVGAQVVLRKRGRIIFKGPSVVLRGRDSFTLSPPGRSYRGILSLSASLDKLKLILTLPLPTYVQAVTGDEMVADWPIEALAAQAIAVRTYAVAMLGQHKLDGYDFCDLTHCQSFRGTESGNARVSAAVRHTENRVLGWHGKAIPALWHSTCAGRRAANDEVFGGERNPLLAGGTDLKPDGTPWCADSPHAHPWAVSYPIAAVQNALTSSHVLAPGESLRALGVSDVAEDGVALSVRVQGARLHTVTGYDCWMALGPYFGWGEIKSPRFTVGQKGERISFSGTGLGHLVGMCQWGARGRALAGQDWRAIVQAYYPGAQEAEIQMVSSVARER